MVAIVVLYFTSRIKLSERVPYVQCSEYKFRNPI